jgi:hypothetical protein
MTYLFCSPLLFFLSRLVDGAGVAFSLLFPCGCYFIAFGGWCRRRSTPALSFFFCRMNRVWGVEQSSLPGCSSLLYLLSYDGAGVALCLLTPSLFFVNDGAGIAPHLLYPSSFVV